MAHQAPKVDWDDESQVDKMSRKAKESPFMVVGEYITKFYLNLYSVGGNYSKESFSKVTQKNYLINN